MSAETINSRAADIFYKGYWADVEFIFPPIKIGSDLEDQKPETLSAHKLILAIASPVFEQVFFHDLSTEPNLRQPVVVQDITYDTFYMFLRYIYTREITLDTIDTAFDVYYAANKFSVSELKHACEALILLKLDATNACRVYEFGCYYNKPNIQEAAMEIIQNETDSIITSSQFLKSHFQTVLDILDQEFLEVKEEIDLFNALTKYSIENAIVRYKPDSDEDSPILDALRKIRFLTMSLQDFNGPILSSKLLTDDEKLRIVHCLTCSESLQYGLPDGFCNLLEPRGIPDEEILSKLETALLERGNLYFLCCRDVQGRTKMGTISAFILQNSHCMFGRDFLDQILKEEEFARKDDESLNDFLLRVVKGESTNAKVALISYIRLNRIDKKFLK